RLADLPHRRQGQPARLIHPTPAPARASSSSLHGTTAMNLRHAILPLALALSLPAVAYAAQRGFTVQDLAYMDRYFSPTLSPDGRVLVFAKRVVNRETNKAASTLWMRNLVTRDMRPPQRVSPEGWSVNSPAFSPDGATLYFLSAKSGSMQLYAMPAAGGEA